MYAEIWTAWSFKSKTRAAHQKLRLQHTSEAQAPAGTQEQAVKATILFSILNTALTIAGQEWECSYPVNLL